MRRRSSAALFSVALFGVSVGNGRASEIVPFRAMDDGATTISDLRDRPIRLPHLGRHDPCPAQRAASSTTPQAGLGVHVGPVTAVTGTDNGDVRFSQGSRAWASGKILWLVDANEPALLVRGQRLDGHGAVRFRSRSGSTSDLVLDQDATSTVGPELRDQPSGPRVKTSGCYGLQVDGPDFQVTIVFRARVFGASATYGTRSLDVRDLRLDDGEALGISLHPSEMPIEIESSERNVEICPQGWPSFAGFESCLPVDPDGHATLPSTVSNLYHLGILVRGISQRAIEIDRVTITYELEDAYFIVHPAPISPDEKTARLVVMPTVRPSIAIGLYEAGTNGRPSSGVSVVLHQGGKHVRRGGIPAGRGDTYGPLEVHRPVELRARNSGSAPAVVDLLVDWY